MGTLLNTIRSALFVMFMAVTVIPWAPGAAGGTAWPT